MTAVARIVELHRETNVNRVNRKEFSHNEEVSSILDVFGFL